MKGAALRPPLMSVRSDLVVRALHKISHHQQQQHNASHHHTTSPSTTTTATPNQILPSILGRVFYDPFLDPSDLLDAELMKKGVGGKLEVWLDTNWLEGEVWEAGAPSHPATSLPPSPVTAATATATTTTTTTTESQSKSKTEGNQKQGKEAEQDGGGGEGKDKEEEEAMQVDKEDTQAANVQYDQGRDTSWTLWDLPPLQCRKIWGTDVYTDDSDILAACVHSGWLRLGSSAPLFGIPSSSSPPGRAAAAGSAEGNKKRKMEQSPTTSTKQLNHRSLKITIVVAPRLIKYEGSLRAGIRSRSWGNSHDGVSYAIESVELVDVSNA